ncbi:BolA-like protein [Giardia muris]|uniref:BolA-like protein n=1 Tax=Giardia muris TaxID=5742 RepID=A0A4Z1SM19_GIAMU|nr:BolA-like protein [Giardia muris]|eukprot:TNJ26712.1 BolA-like protein [Giardia muris]
MAPSAPAPMEAHAAVLRLVRERISQAFPRATRLEIVDSTPAQTIAANGGAYLTLTLQDQAFAGRSPMERVRMVSPYVEDLLARNRIHAISYDLED